VAQHLKILKALVVLVSVLMMNLKARLAAIVRTTLASADAMNKSSRRSSRQAKVTSVWVATSHRG